MELTPRNILPRASYIDRGFAFLSRLSVGDSLILKIILLVAFISLLGFVATLSTNFQVRTPALGGTYTEGVVGTPRFVNPVLAVTRVDKDVSALVFDGIMKLGKDGSLVPNVAESVTVSEDGLTYNVVLRKNVLFHDGSPLTADDVIFTVGRIQEPSLASPLRPNMEGVMIERLGDYEINFVLPSPYTFFPEVLTFGILPHHIWKDVTVEEFPFSQRNIEPVGSGPYRIENIERNDSGIPESYTLARNEQYHGEKVRIEYIVFSFFPSDEKLITAFNKGLIEGVISFDASNIDKLVLVEEKHEVLSMPYPRTFALFFNQNKSPALRDQAVRKALNMVVDRNSLIEEVLNGYGTPLYGPVPEGFGITPTPAPASTQSGDPFEDARVILKSAGWKLNEARGVWEKEIDKTVVPLSFSIATVNTPVFEKTAERLAATWKQLGAEVSVKQFELSDLTQSIIRPRDYESLLFGTILGRSLDLYSFWHSSQRNDPRLNIALYANLTTDAALETIRTTQDNEARAVAFEAFSREIEKELPAIFLYTPKLVYVFPTRIVGESFTGVGEPHERFATLAQWYINTESVWPPLRGSTE